MSTTTTTTTPALRGTFHADQGHSSFQAKAKHMEVGSFRTSFDDVEATLTDESGALVLEGRAQVESIGIRRPAELRKHVVEGADFFDAGNHPEITYRAADLDLAGDGTARAIGELTIKGQTNEVEATGNWQEPIEDPYGKQRTALELTAVIDRRDFGLGWQADLPKGGKALGWEVEISVHLEFVEAD